MWYYIIGGISLAVGILVGFLVRKIISERAIKSAKTEAERIISEAKQTAEVKKKESIIEAKEEILRFKNENEREIKERRNELQRLERRSIQKEENLDRKLDSIDKKDEALSKKIKEYTDAKDAIEEIKNEQVKTLQTISGMTAEEAKTHLISKVEAEARHEMAVKLNEVENEFRETANDKAKNIISLAIQRCAADSVAEATVSVVDLPNDEMKGRIIGREGRNIRAIETMTGVDLVIDDTPEAITISCFDPIRREIARLSLEKLIADGRIHPSRIEEMVEKSKKEVEQIIKKEGEQATFETSVHGLNHELIKILGRLRYRTSYGQNVLKHSIEVSFIAGMIAYELGIDATLAKRAGLLHDIGKAMDHEIEGSHVQIGVDIAKKYKENKDVIHAIEAHHGDVEPHSLVAMIVQAADAISAARPGARRENLETYIKRLQKLEEISTSFAGVEKAFAIQAGREIRIMVKPEDINDENMVFVAREIAKKIESELEYPGQIKINLIRETRVYDFAK
ncbi:MAG: ribonuclease Y [Clostridiales bacterium GWF2_38_85]|nr:MAG: ribonuclease Y [Clostridiales bacterium GWF2_38_85]HBL85511.1 ribonuclease Y [Clostridiales bacterium]